MINLRKISKDRKIYYTSYLAAIVGGFSAAYFVTDYLTNQGAAKGTIATCATITKSASFILTNITVYSLFHLHNYNDLSDWQKDIKKDLKSLFKSGMGSSIVAVILRGLFHYGFMFVGIEERIAMFIGYFATGGLPTYLKYRSDLKNNVVDKNLERIVTGKTPVTKRSLI
jgi:hypothetical protein